MKNLIKIIASLTALTLMTACAGGVTVNNTNVPVNCETNAFHVDCNAIASAIKLRQDMCLADATTSPLCTGEAGIVTVFCEADPFNAETACGHANYDDDRAKIQTDCLAGTGEEGTCDRAVVVVCGANPYDRLCLEEEDYDAARMQIQNDCQSSATACTETTLNNYCTANPFRRLCSSADYDIVRTPLCIADKITNDCTNTIVRACTDDPFSDLCAGESNYNNTREGICVTETTSDRCMPTVDRVCPPNIYDPVCNGTTYADMRSVADSQTEIGTRDCANNPAVGACIFLYAFLCGETPLDSLCDAQGKYRDARRTLCLKDTADPVACATTISQVCLSKPLDSLCDGLIAYASAQETACRGESATSKPECATTLTRVCGNLLGTSPTGDPFSLTCRNAVFDDARGAVELACVTVTNGRLCQAVRDNTCATTPFDPVCAGDNKYLPLQIRACIGQEATGNCVSEAFFADDVIRGCLADPTDELCTAPGSAFKPHQIIAQDVACLLNGVLAGCANPTVAIPDYEDLPATIRALRENSDLAVPYNASTNQYITGFVNFDSTVLNDATGNLDAAKINALGNYTTEDTGVLAQDRAITLRRGGAGSTNKDGVAYFYTFGESSQGDTAYSYGGILSTTNLGAPLLPQPVAQGADNITAIWDGHFSFRNGIINRETEFLVDFTAGTMGFAKPVGTDGMRPPGTTFLGVGADGAHSIKFGPVDLFIRLDAAFGPNAKKKTTTYDTVTSSLIDTTTDLTLAPGELGGNVFLYYRPTSDATREADPDHFVRDNSTIHGLIGQEGAVGVFLEPGRVGYADGNIGGHTRVGGFVASNPDHVNNQ